MAPAPSHYFLVTTFKNPADARPEFEQTTRALPSSATSLLFGDSVIIELPAGAESEVQEWFGRFFAKSTNTFIASNNVVQIALSFVAPNLSAATNLEQDLKGYFRVCNLNLIPPWDPLTESAAFASKREARKVWNRIRQQIFNVTAEGMKTDVMNAATHTNESAVEHTNRLNDFEPFRVARGLIHGWMLRMTELE
jgi:hypothetical protein